MIALLEAFKKQKVVHKNLEKKKHTEGPWTDHCDNQAWIGIKYNAGCSVREKHIELRFLAIPDVVNSRKIDLLYSSSAYNNANIITNYLLPQAKKNATIRLLLLALQ